MRQSNSTIIPKNFKSTLPPRKRAKTKEEREQRRIERIIRNRKAAHQSREKKRLQLKFFQEKCQLLERILSELDVDIDTENLIRANPVLGELFATYRENYLKFEYTPKVEKGHDDETGEKQQQQLLQQQPVSASITPVSEEGRSRAPSITVESTATGDSNSSNSNTSINTGYGDDDDDDDILSVVPTVTGNSKWMEDTGIIPDPVSTTTESFDSLLDPVVYLTTSPFASSTSSSSSTCADTLDIDFSFTGEGVSDTLTDFKTGTSASTSTEDGLGFDLKQEDYNINDNDNGEITINTTTDDSDPLGLYSQNTYTYGSLELDDWRNPAVIALLLLLLLLHKHKIQKGGSWRGNIFSSFLCVCVCLTQFRLGFSYFFIRCSRPCWSLSGPSQFPSPSPSNPLP